MFLELEEQAYRSWLDRIAQNMNATRRATVDRSYRKRIQAYKIVIYVLTPREMRDSDMPGMWER